jgi:hypothetical protein
LVVAEGVLVTTCVVVPVGEIVTEVVVIAGAVVVAGVVAAGVELADGLLAADVVVDAGSVDVFDFAVVFAECRLVLYTNGLRCGS